MRLKNKWIDIALAINCLILFILSLYFTITNVISIVEELKKNITPEGANFSPIVLILVILGFTVLSIFTTVFIIYSVVYIKNYLQKKKIEQIINKDQNINGKKGFFPNILTLSINIIVASSLIYFILISIKDMLFNIDDISKTNNYLLTISEIIALFGCFCLFILDCFFCHNKLFETKTLKNYINKEKFDDLEMEKSKKINRALSIMSIIVAILIFIFATINIVTNDKFFKFLTPSILLILLYVGFILFFVFSSLFYHYETENKELLNEFLNNSNIN